jgi:hypothetical protein
MGEVQFNADVWAQMVRSSEVADDLARRAVNVEGAAKGFCPVDTGRLRASITTAPGEDDEGLFADIGSDVEYARYVEEGTFRQRAQPYLAPALDAANG